MKENELKLHPCYCGGEMEIKKVAQNGGMDGTYWNWELVCNKCGLTKTYAADGFYGRKYKTFEEVVNDWNWNKKKEKIIKADILDKIRAEIQENINYNKKMNYQGIVAGLLLTLDIIDKYRASTKQKVRDHDR